MRLTLDLTEGDYLAFARHAADHQPIYVAMRKRYQWTLVVCSIIAAGLVGGFAAWALPFTGMGRVIAVVIASTVVLVVSLINGVGIGSYRGRKGGWPGAIERQVKKAMKAGHLSPDLGRVEVELTPAGLGMTSRRGTVLYEWSAVREAVRSPEHVFVYVSKTEACVVPVRDLGSEEKVREFVEEVERYREKAVAGHDQPA